MHGGNPMRHPASYAARRQGLPIGSHHLYDVPIEVDPHYEVAELGPVVTAMLRARRGAENSLYSCRTFAVDGNT